MQPRDLLKTGTIALVYLAVILAGATVSYALDPCVVAEDPPGTVRLPPEGCAYLSPQEVHMIIDGLPPGTTIELDPIHLAFFCRSPAGNEPCSITNGGPLGGQQEEFDSILVFELRGTGALDGFRRILSLDAAAVTHTGPRTPGDPEQSFDTDMFQLQGTLVGDPDFDLLQVTAGTGFGLPSPGHTTLTDRGDDTFQVDSFFDITYQITFTGAPGGALDGLSGTTTGTVRMEASGQKDPCTGTDDGSGTVVLPPEDCDYLSPQEVHMILDGLPPGTTIELDPIHADFFCPTGVCGAPGGSLGGQAENFTSNLVLQLRGTGTLADFRRILHIPAAVETHTGPRTPGDPVQSFATEMASLQGTLPPDGDFASLVITAGSNNGLPSPGHAVLQDRGDGTYQIDSFFDITYQIDFVGAPLGTLDGLSGSTQGTVRMEAKTGRDPLDEPDNGLGTATMPPESGHYVSALDVHTMIDGLPPGTTIELGPSHRFFHCQTTPCGVAGGTFPGGEIETFISTLDLELTGTGDLTGLNRQILVPVDVETHTGPRITDVMITRGQAVAGPTQRFDTDMFRLQGSLLGDPDFASLQIVAGTDNAMPSPGHTTLTDLGGGIYQIDSFFDITYRIDFVGAPGGALDGMSGSTTGNLRVNAVEDPAHLPRDVTIFVDVEPDDANDFSYTGTRGNFSLDDDADPTLPNWRRLFNLIPGPYVITQAADPDWVLLSILCDDPDGGTTTNPTTRQVTVDIDLGESFTCTFTNVLAADFIFADGFESGNVSAWSSSVP